MDTALRRYDGECCALYDHFTQRSLWGRVIIMQYIYKYFDKEDHLQNFIDNGEVMFNQLSYFLYCEDKARRDGAEDSNIFRPENGLEITNLTTRVQFIDKSAFISQIKNPHRVFVFCTSTEYSDYLYKKFNSVGCIRIDLEKFKNKIRTQLLHHSVSVKNKIILADKICYYSEDNSHGTRYACPDKIIMSKLLSFADESEYRFAFAQDKDAFEVNNVNLFIANERAPLSEIKKPIGKLLTLGNLSEICQRVITN